MKSIKKDMILLLGILLAAVLVRAAFLLADGLSTAGEGCVRVYQDGRESAIYPLAEERTVMISWGEENYNLLSICGGEAFILEADCPDRLCVSQRRISKNGESIICLPHKLVVQVSSGKESETDAVAY